MSRSDSRPGVFAYLDFRAFLKDAYNERKKRGLSHRWLARRAGLSSPSFLKAVMDGQKNLAPATAKRVASAIGLSDDAAEYFRLLVAVNQTSDPSERRTIHAHLGRLRNYQDVRALEGARDAYYRKWYLPAIRELSMAGGFQPDPKWIARALRPRILVSEAKRAIRTLEQLGLLRPDDSGTLRATHAQVTSELEPRSAHVASYHRAMIALASRTIDDVPRAERDISSITLCADATGLVALKRRLQEIRRELLDEFDAGRSGVQVVQVNFQLFPLSKRLDEDTEKP